MCCVGLWSSAPSRWQHPLKPTKIQKEGQRVSLCVLCLCVSPCPSCLSFLWKSAGVYKALLSNSKRLKIATSIKNLYSWTPLSSFELTAAHDSINTSPQISLIARTSSLLFRDPCNCLGWPFLCSSGVIVSSIVFLLFFSVGERIILIYLPWLIKLSILGLFIVLSDEYLRFHSCLNTDCIDKTLQFDNQTLFAVPNKSPQNVKISRNCIIFLLCIFYCYSFFLTKYIDISIMALWLCQRAQNVLFKHYYIILLHYMYSTDGSWGYAVGQKAFRSCLVLRGTRSCSGQCGSCAERIQLESLLLFVFATTATHINIYAFEFMATTWRL